MCQQTGEKFAPLFKYSLKMLLPIKCKFYISSLFDILFQLFWRYESEVQSVKSLYVIIEAQILCTFGNMKASNPLNRNGT